MKILIVLLRLRGGVGRANNGMADALRKRGHEVDLLSREDDLKIFSFFKSIFPLRKKIKELVKKNNYSIIYTQDYSCALPLFLPFPIYWRKHFCCFCGTKKGKSKGQLRHKIIQKIVGRIMGKKLVAIGDSIHKRFPKSTKIYRGINFKEFKPIKKRRKCLGWIERDTENITKEELEKVTKLTNLKLIIAKGIPPKKMNEFYNECKVFVSLPNNDGYNNSWNEAIAAGVPIIIGNNEGAGSFLPFDKILDEKDMEKRIREIIKNPKKINYRNWIIKKGLTWDNAAEKLLKVFEMK